MCRVQALLAHVDAEDFEDLVGHRLEQQLVGIALDEPLPEVVKRLLARMRVAGVQRERRLVGEVELQVEERLVVGEVEHVLDYEETDERLHREVRSAVGLVIQVAERPLVDEGKRHRAERPRPRLLQPAPLLLGEQRERREQAPLVVLLSKHVAAPPALDAGNSLNDAQLGVHDAGGFYGRINHVAAINPSIRWSAAGVRPPARTQRSASALAPRYKAISWRKSMRRVSRANIGELVPARAFRSMAVLLAYRNRVSVKVGVGSGR